MQSSGNKCTGPAGNLASVRRAFIYDFNPSKAVLVRQSPLARPQTQQAQLVRRDHVSRPARWREVAQKVQGTRSRSRQQQHRVLGDQQPGPSDLQVLPRQALKVDVARFRFMRRSTGQSWSSAQTLQTRQEHRPTSRGSRMGPKSDSASPRPMCARSTQRRRRAGRRSRSASTPPPGGSASRTCQTNSRST